MALTYSTKVPLGSGTIDFSLPGTDGVNYSPSSFKSAEVLVIVFTCNHCPYAQAIWPRLIDFQARFKDRGVQLVGINPNDAANYPEDHPREMKKKVKEWGINFPYLFDESQETARAYDAQCTPDLYVYDRARKLRYHGRLDDNWQDPAGAGGAGTWGAGGADPAAVQRRELEEAVAALLAGRSPADRQNPSMGCSIKWK